MTEPAASSRAGFAGPSLPVVLKLDAIRAKDQFVGTFEFQNMTLDKAAATLTAAAGGGTIILHLPPQHIAEQAFLEGEDFLMKHDVTKTELPTNTRLAGPTRLAFAVPANQKVTCTIAGVLEACRSLPLNVTATALPPPPAPAPAPIVAPARSVAGVAAHTSPIERAQARARRQRWQDNTDLVPVLLTAPAPEPSSHSALPPARRPALPPPTRFVVDADGATPVVEPGPRAVPALAAPSNTETAIELPYRLIISPNVHAAWAHRTLPVPGTFSELWHTRLATRVADASGALKTVEDDHPLRAVRAVWCRDKEFSPNVDQRPMDPQKPEPFRTSLTQRQRFDIVHSSANHALSGVAPVDVDRLMLTSLGGWIDSRGRWGPADPRLSLLDWRHRGTMGRDHYVRVVEKGYLFPFGHQAALITITERKFQGGTGNPAILRQRIFVVVRQPLLTYGLPGQKNAQGFFYDLQFPFTSVRIRTVTTPDLDNPQATQVLAFGTQMFWPFVGGQPFRFHLTAEDIEANRVDFTAPLIFVEGPLALGADPAPLQQGKTAYEGFNFQGKVLSEVPVGGRRIALGPSFEPGDTSFEVRDIAFGADVGVTTLGNDRGRFYPRVRTARVVVPAIKQFTGAAEPAPFKYASQYLTQGLPAERGGKAQGLTVAATPANLGEVFLEVANVAQAPALDFKKVGDKAGAFVQPNIPDLGGISRLTGPIAGSLDELASGTFDPMKFFESLDARLFGIVDLGEVIAKFVGELGLDLADAMPSFVTEAFAAVDAFLAGLKKAQQQIEQLRAAAEAEYDKIKNTNVEAEVKQKLETAMKDAATLRDGVTGAVDKIADAIEQLVQGIQEGDPLGAVKEALVTFRNLLVEAKGQLAKLPPQVPAEVKKALQATVDRFLAELGTAVDVFDDVEKHITRLMDALQLPEELKMKFEWKPELQHWPDPDNAGESLFVAHNSDGNTTKKATFVLSAEMEAKTKLHPDPRFEIAARLHNFSLNLIGPAVSFMVLRFNKLEFTAGSGAKPDVNVEFDDISFAGPLSFVEALRDLIPLDGFSDPPALDISEKGIAASYSLGLPDVAFGVFSLQNLSLGAGFNVPFLLDPLTVRFNFCERESPFILTVAMFGGGGFFGITLDPDGIEIMEASFEFGASIAMNFGVASGGITVMGGIYFKMQGDEVTLTGYIRMGGEVEALGLISISIELYMSLTYESSTGKCIGRATITIEIEIAFFSIPLEISVERKLAGSDGDPTFAELMGPGPDLEPGEDPWTEYCRAFT
ncbi:MAG TPA: hypothetical protein VHF24_09085 [Acidimicrobiales bacterium]|nr:hypothetical protein [Acidimicrobiales bacterium]